ncbi:MAG: T9SS type A sorting domain-containing protein [Melioribacteraceae bacterium]
MAKNIFSAIIILLLILNSPVYSESDKQKKKLQKTNTEVHHAFFNINNISTYIYNNGSADIAPNGNSGFIYPKGSNKSVIFESGFVWGAKINGEVRVGGSMFRSGLRPGKILPNGIAENPSKESVRVYRVRPDYKTADLSSEINDERITEEEIRNQYKLDWNEWPGNEGAPFDDLDNDGIYNLNKDIPGVPGADQTLWFVANDFDSNKIKELYGSAPLGVEMQTTVWGYNKEEPLGNMLFKKYKLINKSVDNFDSMYISIWSDPDLGGAGDDYVGCDTLLNLAFVYNGREEDNQYGKNPPSMGFKILQGPIVDGKPLDVGLLNGRAIKGKKNLSMTSFHNPFKCCYPNGDANSDTGYYNYMKGNRLDGSPFPIPDKLGGGTTKFPLSGDPITHSGFIDGTLYPPGDRRLGLGSGPFTMAVGDTQEVIFAEIVAGAKPHIDRLSSIEQLKIFCGIAQNYYENNFSFKPLTSFEDINVQELNREIVMSWYNNNNLGFIEKFKTASYSFQGYTVYQFPKKDATLEEAKEVLTYDIIDGKAKIITRTFNSKDGAKLFTISKNGSDSGIKRHASITKDAFNSNKPLYNGTEYYFGLSSYSVSNNLNLFPNVIESDVLRFSAVPQSTKPGTSIKSKYGDTLKINHISGNGNIRINVVVVNPFELKGKDYKIVLEKSSDTSKINYENFTWSLIDDENNFLIENQKIIIPNKFGLTEPIIIDGFQVEPFILLDKQNDDLTESDEFIFATTKTVINNNDLAKQDVEKINVFPNPYYSTHTNEVDQYLKYITFTHLPRKAVIRIYNLAGHLVRTFHKNDESQFLKWYLTNKNNIPIGSGMYIAYIELPELSETKILKFAIILETYVPSYF